MILILMQWHKLFSHTATSFLNFFKIVRRVKPLLSIFYFHRQILKGLSPEGKLRKIESLLVCSEVYIPDWQDKCETTDWFLELITYKKAPETNYS